MNEIVSYQGAAIATADEIVAQTLRVQEVMKKVMKPDVHYGVIPGTKKNTLYKPGAEVLCMTFHIAPTYPSVVEERFDDGVRYRVKCVGIHQASGVTVAEGIGSCSSMEEKYKWRRTYIKKEWEAAPPDRRRIDYWKGKDGREGESLQVRVETADIENTLLKMAAKRAFIAMVLNAVAASDVFAQDLEDLSKKARDVVVGDDDEESRSSKEPRAKSGNGGTDAETREVEQSPIASEGQLKHTAKKLEAAGKTLAQALVHFKLGPDAKLTAKQCNDFIVWSQRPEGDPSKEPGLAEQA